MVEVLATMSRGEGVKNEWTLTGPSAAVSEGRIFLRGPKSLTCIGQKYDKWCAGYASWNCPPWVGQAFDLSLALSNWRQLGLAFLLGSFAVATWSDLKRLSAQRE